ncbi:MAG: dTMP kinase [Proteobacteria bacterium]|jgi:dTMP kinase|nr:dTMP kinase [Pseudomonadota bacterium]
MSGRFITLEGSEGAGKSTNVDTVCETLTEAGIDFVRTREPGGTPMAEALRDAMLHKWDESVDGITELLLVFAARAQHLSHVIRPALAAGRWVVCDRFTDATFAYQGYGRRLDLEKLAALESWIQGELQPDITLYLDVAPDVAEQRIAAREKDRMEVERRDFFVRVRQGYLDRASEHERFEIIDAGNPLQEVQAEVRLKTSEFIRRARRG